MSRELLRVAVVSPQSVVRTGLTTMLEGHPDRLSVVPAPDGPHYDDPDVVLYDVLALVDRDTKELAHIVEMTISKVLAVSRELRPDLLATALAVGADGFVSLDVEEDELLDAVESAGTGWEAGDSGADPTVGSSGSAARAQRLGRDLGLSEREISVVALIARGRTNQEIARELWLSINSVKTYVRNAYRKIGVTNRAQAVGWAIRHGFSADPDAS